MKQEDTVMSRKNVRYAFGVVCLGTRVKRNGQRRRRVVDRKRKRTWHGRTISREFVSANDNEDTHSYSFTSFYIYFAQQLW